MNDLDDSLPRIESSFMRLNRAALLNGLQPGLDPDQVEAILRSAGLPSSPELERIFVWHNGTSFHGVERIGDVWFFPGFYLLALEDAVLTYATLVNDSRWSAGQFPLFADGGGDFYTVDLAADSTGTVRRFRLEEAQMPIEYLTVADMTGTIAAAYERDLFYVDDAGYLEMDDIEFAALAAEFNPAVTWWTD